MTKRMLIDATHPEETRVVVVDGNRLEDFDFEVASKKQLKGNIYLAKVTRVEPSLQAAFVEYGGNRHGFLPFAEIHPDYYQIPMADRLELERLTRAQARRQEEDEQGDQDEDATQPDEPPLPQDSESQPGENGDTPAPTNGRVETVGGDEDVQVSRRTRPMHSYKIQEVIKRRQIMLIQVVKEERGNKGAALTTFLSLAGRYCVLMPNTERGGGVSRKITNSKDRKRLKTIIEALDLPEGMSVILRTAGMERTKAEIKRDFDYLLRLWDSIRDKTLQSIAPCVIFEEANLIRRSIRDLYARDIEEVLVEGEDGYRIAKDFMRMLMPSHARRVQPYREETMPLLHRFQVETQIDAMHSPIVQLKSGGYIVIDQTEALVSIDVNSGRSTRERNIEETALRTNSEAADEIARQLRLRDLAGLIVIDFIDMEDHRNDQAVERRLKDAMKADRARIQVGRISPFGLLELSRQRLRPSILETTYTVCPHCAGTGMVRSPDSAALHVLRAIEEEGLRRKAAEILIHVPAHIALFILNQKRDTLISIEQRYQMRVLIERDDTLINPLFRIERLRAKTLEEQQAALLAQAEQIRATTPPVIEPEDEVEDEVEVEAEIESQPSKKPAARAAAAAAATAPAQTAATPTAAETEAQAAARNKRKRRRRRPRRPDEEGNSAEASNGDETGEFEPDDTTTPEPVEGEAVSIETNATEVAPLTEADANDAEGEAERRKRRRGKRGGRRRARRREDGSEILDEQSADEANGDDQAGDDQNGDDQNGDEGGYEGDEGGEQADTTPAPTEPTEPEQTQAEPTQADFVPVADELPTQYSADLPVSNWAPDTGYAAQALEPAQEPVADFVPDQSAETVWAPAHDVGTDVYVEQQPEPVLVVDVAAGGFSYESPPVDLINAEPAPYVPEPMPEPIYEQAYDHQVYQEPVYETPADVATETAPEPVQDTLQQPEAAPLAETTAVESSTLEPEPAPATVETSWHTTVIEVDKVADRPKRGGWWKRS